MKNNRTFLEKLLDGAEVEWKPLGDVCNFQNGFAFKSSLFKDNGAPIVRITNIDGKEVNLSDVKYFLLDDYNTDMTPYKVHKGDILIAMSGATTGKIGFYNYEHPSYLNQRVGKFLPNTNILNNRYLYHYLLSKVEDIYIISGGGAQPNLSSNRLMSEVLIPIPPLSVQTEIVKILDALTALTSELTSELILRQKQYEYYREKLLSHNDSENSSQQKVDKDKLFSTSNIQWLHLNEIYKFQYGIGNKIPTIGGEYPVYGSNGIVGSHNEYNSEDAPVIGHIGAYAGIVNWAEGKHFVTYNGIICNKINDNVNSRYAYYLLLSQNFIDKANKASQPFISYDILNKCIVPVPPIEEQQRIVSILDKFETLTNSITEGLPLAIEQSQKRYEYYRELLLNFPGRE
ncbi:TPA: restriction endonuclease subunit S [Haemophilus influenzae]|uniref:restriction endonuclease subunit S n=1 Tax=Haemophilus influenzae TaxID=727 RepID=UPI00313C572A